MGCRVRTDGLDSGKLRVDSAADFCERCLCQFEHGKRFCEDDDNRRLKLCLLKGGIEGGVGFLRKRRDTVHGSSGGVNCLVFAEFEVVLSGL